jgi:hypothetical protein
MSSTAFAIVDRQRFDVTWALARLAGTVRVRQRADQSARTAAPQPDATTLRGAGSPASASCRLTRWRGSPARRRLCQRAEQTARTAAPATRCNTPVAGRAHASLPAQATPRTAGRPGRDRCHGSRGVGEAGLPRTERPRGRKRDRGGHECRYLGPAGRVPVTRNGSCLVAG